MSAIATATEDLLRLENVVKAYGSGAKQFVAIRDVNFMILPGEFVCLLGPSGCGKSTLLRIIAGLIKASSGTVLYRGHALTGVNPHTTIVFQTFALFPWLTVEQNVEVALKARGVQHPQRRERALQLIDMVGLGGFEMAYPRELSSGMRQKVGFARAMAIEPELLCLDEPFSALDVLSAEALRGELMELWLSRSFPTKAILMVTHNIEEAVLMADRIVVMDKDPGRIITEIDVTLSHPRARKDTVFQAIEDKVYAAVAGKTEEEIPAPGLKNKLPRASLDALAGLVERLAAEGGRVDLYRLSADLVLELDDLLPIVETGELIEFLAVEEGDLILRPLGQMYADATILARKELLAGRILRLPTIIWIYDTLKKDNNQRIDKYYFIDMFRAELGDIAKEQFDVAVSWGRYAELFDYDPRTDELYLES